MKPHFVPVTISDRNLEWNRQVIKMAAHRRAIVRAVFKIQHQRIIRRNWRIARISILTVFLSIIIYLVTFG